LVDQIDLYMNLEGSSEMSAQASQP